MSTMLLRTSDAALTMGELMAHETFSDFNEFGM